MKVYTPRTYRILLNIIYGVAAAVVAWIIAYQWLSQLTSMCIGLAVLVGYLWLVVYDSRVTIAVDDQWLSVTKGKTIKRFAIEGHGFRARTKTSSGNTECHLYVIDADGHEEHIDCELIGI